LRCVALRCVALRCVALRSGTGIGDKRGMIWAQGASLVSGITVLALRECALSARGVSHILTRLNVSNVRRLFLG